MEKVLKPPRQESLNEIFMSRFEEYILSGQLSIGWKLPSERDLTPRRRVSRPVGLVDLDRNHVRDLYKIIEAEKKADDTESKAKLDFTFHHQVVMAGKNLIYPPIINSFQVIYTDMSSRVCALPGVHDQALAFHTEIPHAIEAGDAGHASSSMAELLRHARLPE